MKLLLVLSAVLCVLSAQNMKGKEGSMQQWYMKTQQKYHMNVVSSSKEESRRHFKDFCDFAKAVLKHNEEDPDGYEAEVNMFALMPKSERYHWTGLNASQIMDNQRRSFSKRSDIILAEKRQNVDYRGKLPAVKNQGGCGSCWSFGAAAALEYQLNRNSDKVKAISEQQYLDCTYEGKRDGCNGGWPTDCYTWTKNNGNLIASMEEYPYTGKDGRCNTDIKNPIKGYSVTGFSYLQKGDSAMLAAVADPAIGVISVAFGVIDSFFQYKSGVYKATGCSSINHALDVVGYGSNYWITRNSWGSNWGDKGYVNVLRGANTCAIADYGHYPRVTGSDPDDGDDGDDGSDDSDGGDKKLCDWTPVEDQKLKKKIKGLEKMNMEDARKACIANAKCKGISCKNKNSCWLNEKPRGKTNKKFTGYIKKCKKATS